MDAEIHEYWRRRLEEACTQRDELAEQLRHEVARLQGRCNELSTINSMGRASVAMDIREWAINNAAVTPNGVMAVPLTSLVDFLHVYTNGLVPQLPREHKRVTRDDDDDDLHDDESPRLTLPAAALPSRMAPKPITPTVAQLLAQRQQVRPPTISPAPQPPLVVTQAASNDNDETALATDGLTQESEDAERAVPSVSPSAHEDRKRRDRGEAMEDEAAQIRPWLFSRVP